MWIWGWRQTLLALLGLVMTAAVSGARVRRGPEEGPCALLSARWTQVSGAAGARGHLYRLQLRAGPPDGAPAPPNGAPRRVFPERPLFSFIRSLYRCCRSGHHCASVKGLQGREAGGSRIEFLLSDDVLSATVVRAEVHLHLTNPQHLNIQPLLPSLDKQQMSTRYSAWSKDGTVELRVDLTFLFQALQQVLGARRGGPSLMEMRRLGGLSRPWASDARNKAAVLQDTLTVVWGEGSRDGQTERPHQAALELGLALHCSSPDLNTEPCQGVGLLHTPFITLSYR